MKKQIICINWGTKYGPKYINRLYGMVSRNITPPFDFVCFTDNFEGIRPEVRTFDLPPIGTDMPTGTRGKWPKSRLWGPTLGDLTGPVLYLDLDVMVVGCIDSFFEFGTDKDVVLARNPNTPFERLGQTSIFRFPVGKLLPLQEVFLEDPQTIANQYYYEQRFVTRNAPGGVKFFPKKWVAHFRLDCIPFFPFNYFFEPKLPGRAKAVIFPGGLNQELAIEGRWSKLQAARTAKDYLHWVVFERSRAPFFRSLRHYLRPASWVKQHWVD